MQLHGCRTSSLKWEYVLSPQAFSGRGLLCPLLETLQANKNIEGGRTSKSRLLEHFKGFKDSGRNFLNFLPKRHSSIYISSIVLTLKYYDTTKLHQPALQRRSPGSKYLMEHSGKRRNKSLLKSDRSLDMAMKYHTPQSVLCFPLYFGGKPFCPGYSL